MYKLQLYRYATCAFTYHTIFIINQPPVNLSKQFSVTHEISIIIPKEIDIFQTARMWRRFVKHPGYKTPPPPPQPPGSVWCQSASGPGVQKLIRLHGVSGGGEPGGNLNDDKICMHMFMYSKLNAIK